jgi:hypothetical protein
VLAMAKHNKIENFFQLMYDALLKEQNKNMRLYKCGRRSRDMDYAKENPEVMVHFYIPITGFAYEQIKKLPIVFPGVPDNATNKKDNEFLNEAIQWFKETLKKQTNDTTIQTIAKIFIHPSTSVLDIEKSLQSALTLGENYHKNAGEILNPNYQKETVLALFNEDIIEKKADHHQSHFFRPAKQSANPMKYIGFAGVTLGVLYLAYCLYTQPEKAKEFIFRM